MIGYQVNCLTNSRISVFKSVKPLPKIDSAMLHKIYMLFTYSSLFHKVKHLSGIHALHSTSGMSYNHYLVDTKHIYRNKN